VLHDFETTVAGVEFVRDDAALRLAS